jgi:hypothetical protein
MKAIYLILTMLGFNPDAPTTNKLSFQEKRYVNNIVTVRGYDPIEIIKLDNGKIQINYPNEHITIGQDGFIHDLEILEGNVWIDLGPEY